MDTLEERFWSKVRKGPDCWEWTGSLDTQGYGVFRFREGRLFKAHRVSWELVNLESPGSSNVLHECDNRKCVRPSHLFLGTPKDNAQDREAKGRGIRPRTISEETLRQMRRLRALPCGVGAIAKRFGVSVWTVWDKVQGVDTGRARVGKMECNEQ